MFFEKNTNQFTINQDQTVSDLNKKLDTTKENFFCVLDNNKKIVGVLSLGDLARSHLKVTDDKEHLSSIMNKNFHSLKHGAPLSTLIHYLEKYRFVPIVDKYPNLYSYH